MAVVNGEPIRLTELKRQVRVFQSVRPGAQDDESTRRTVLDQLIKQRLLVQAARRAGLGQDAALQGRLDERRRALRRELEKSIADAKAQLEGLDAAVESRSLIEAYSQDKRKAMSIGDKDLKEAYRLRQVQGSVPPFEQVRDQLLEQVILDRLVDEERSAATIELHTEALR